MAEPGTVDTEPVDHLSDAVRDAARQQAKGIEPLQIADIADTVIYIITRPRRVAVNEILVRVGDRTW